LSRHEGGGGEGHGASDGDRWKATTMNAVDGGGATAAAAAADTGGVDGAFFFAPFLSRFYSCYGAVLKVKWCCFGDKIGAIFGEKWCCFGYCLAAILGASCWD